MPARSSSSCLGPHLRRLRSAAGLSLRGVEALTRGLPEPVSFEYLSRVETGQVVPSPQKLITFATIYEVPAQIFLDLLELEQYSPYAPRTADPDECRRIGLESLEASDYRKAYAAFNRGLNLLEEGKVESAEGRNHALFKLRNNLGLALTRLGKYRLAQRYLEEALQERDLTDVELLSGLGNLTRVAYQMNRFPIAEGLALAAMRIARRIGNPEYIARCRLHLANIRQDLGNTRGAAAHLRHALKVLSQGPQTVDLNIALINFANCLEALGHRDEALDMYHKGLEMAEARGDRRLRSVGLMNLGRSLYRRGCLDEARKALLESRSIGMTHDYTSDTFHSTYYLWRMALERKVGSEAVELLKALKRLRLKLDERSEEILSFDSFLREIRARKRQKRSLGVFEQAPRRPAALPRAIRDLG